MTLIIVTGEIDLSVASVVGLCSVLLGALHQEAGMSIPAATLIASCVGVVVRRLQRPAGRLRRAALPRRHHRHPRAYRGIAVGLLGTDAVTDFPAK